MYVFLCEDSIDGIFTGIYDAWASGYGHANVALSARPLENYALFDEYIPVATSAEKSAKVARTLQARLGAEIYQELCQAASASERHAGKRDAMDKADALYKTVVLALSLKNGRNVLHYLGEPCVSRVFQLSRSAWNETHHLMGFLRFRELKSGLLFAQIRPRHHVLPLLGAHFSDRLPQENFLICDAGRRQALLHPAGQGFFLTDAKDLDLEAADRLSQQEEAYQSLWRGFVQDIVIKERLNTKLQDQNLPQRFRPDMTEFCSYDASTHQKFPDPQ